MVDKELIRPLQGSVFKDVVKSKILLGTLRKDTSLVTTHQNDEDHWSYEGPNKVCIIPQPASNAKKETTVYI